MQTHVLKEPYPLMKLKEITCESANKFFKVMNHRKFNKYLPPQSERENIVCEMIGTQLIDYAEKVFKRKLDQVLKKEGFNDKMELLGYIMMRTTTRQSIDEPFQDEFDAQQALMDQLIQYLELVEKQI